MKLSLNNNSNAVHENEAVYSPVKPRVLFKDFKILNGKEMRLVERVNEMDYKQIKCNCTR
ncbi:MAG: hypothetical protein AB1390_04725 [Nitrospirota bacterium]